MARVPIDVETARVQHGAYERTLASLGCRVVEVPAAHDLPDSVFIEDTAIVLDEVAIITRPGAQSRQRETDAVAEALASWRQLRLLSPPALLDGGDVLRLGRVLYVGIGSRTNVAAARQLADSVTPYGYAVRAAEAVGCLHLKSAVTELAPGLVLLNPAWVQERTFEGHRAIYVADGEPFAANVLRIGDTIIAASAHDQTNASLHATGLQVSTVDLSELAKAEAGVTCCSLILHG